MSASVVDEKMANLPVEEITEEKSIQNACQVHRCRFFKYEPSTITSIGFNLNGDMIAVARQNGDIELWNTKIEYFHFHGVVSGHSNSVISCVQWTSNNRLFVGSLDGKISEINLNTLRFDTNLHGNGGPIWSMQYNLKDNMIAIGCEDGRIRLFSILDDEPIQFFKILGNSGRRIVSLAWHKSNNSIFSGNDEGIIYHWNISTGRNETRMTLERYGKETAPIVWSLIVLNDFTIISGDSNGNLHTWDGISGTLMQTFAQLTADVLALAVDSSETLLYASGIDNQVIQLRKIKNQWSYSYSHRAHTHDVRTLAISNDFFNPILISGGVDTHLVWYHGLKFNSLRPNKISPIPQRKFLSIANDVRRILIQKLNSLEIWSLNGNHPKMISKLNLSNDKNIISSVISPDGKYIACCTSNKLKVFKIIDEKNIKKLKLNNNISKSGYTMIFTNDSKKLIIGDINIYFIDMISLNIIKIFKNYSKYQTKILTISKDGQWLGCGDINNNIFIFNLDSMLYDGKLPKLNSIYTSIGFHLNSKIIIVTTLNNSLLCFDIENKNLNKWSRENQNKLPKKLFQSSYIKGIIFHPNQFNNIILYTENFLFHIDIEKNIIQNEKRKRIENNFMDLSSSDGENFNNGLTSTYHFIQQYGPIAFADFFSCHANDTPELVIVETPFFKMLSDLPDALHRPKYGMHH